LFENDAAAAEALASANNGGVATPAPAPVEQAPVEAPTNTPVDAGTTQSSESFTTLDLNSVPEELRPIIEEKFNQFNADYTRKTQEIAPIRQIMQDTGLSADDARQALEFVHSLNDPDALRSLYTNLAEQFGNEGGEAFEGGYGGEVDPRDQQINDLSTRLERFEQAQQMNEARSQLDAAVTSLKSAHSDWTDADIERVQQLAVVHMQQPNADIGRAMTAAADQFKSWRDEVLSSYIDGKGNVTTQGTPALGATTHSQTPETFSNLDDATKAALARFGADWAN
jgi:hypothetical protein